MHFYLSRHVWKADAGPAPEIHGVAHLEIIDQGTIVASIELKSPDPETRREEARQLIRQKYSVSDPQFLSSFEFHQMFPNINQRKQ